MPNDKEDDSPFESGRLRVEDRGGRMMDEMLDGFGRSDEQGMCPPEDQEEQWGGGEWGQERVSLIFWGVGLMAVVAVSLMVVLNLKERAEAEDSALVAEAWEGDDESAPSGFMEQASEAEIEKATEKAVMGFMNAASHRERCCYLLGGESMLATLDEFYSRQDAAYLPDGFGKIQSSVPAVFDGKILMLVLAVESSGRRAWAYSLFASGGNEMKIDWLTSVSYGEMNWPQFLKERPREPTQMRVYLRRLGEFEAPWQHDDKYDSFELSAFGYPKEQTEILCVMKGSDEAQHLEKFVRGGGKHPMNLSLKWVEGKEGFWLQLDEVIHNLWTAPPRD